MTSDCDLWLYLLIFLGFGILIKSPRSSLSWSLLPGLQAIIIAMLAMCGLTSKLHCLFAFLSSFWFVLFFMVPWQLMRNIEKHMVCLDAKGITRNAFWIRWLVWGKRGQFSRDVYYAIALFIQGDAEAAHVLLDKWRSPLLPVSFKLLLLSYSLWGELFVRNYSGVVAEYERSVQESESRTIPSLALLASRAYAELGLIDKAARCFEVSKLEESRSRIDVLDRYFVSFFCLAGAEFEAQEKFASLGVKNRFFPEAIKLYWQGRLAARTGNKTQAKDLLTNASQKAIHLSLSWQKLIDSQLANVDREIVVSSDSYRNAIDKIWKISAKCAEVQKMIMPNQHSIAVMSIVIVNVLIFLISNSYSVVPTPVTGWLRLNCYAFGMLLPETVINHGEYWRLLTYLFLHLNLAHLLVNMLALYWFGRITENIFGTARFFLIYFISGLISGFTHLAFAYSTPAIGASGAVMGVFGAVITGMYALKGRIPYAVWRSETNLLIVLGVLQLIADQLIPRVAGAAHIGGFVAGALIGYLMARSDKHLTQSPATASSA